MATNQVKKKPVIKGMKSRVCDKCSCELPAQSFKTRAKKDSKFCSHCRNLSRVGKKVYNQFVQKQHNTCAVCQAKCEDLRIDLNHEGNVRGLVCIDCEVALIEMKQSPITVASALHYLEKDLASRPVRTVQIIVTPGNDVLITSDNFSYWELNAALYRAIEQLEEQQMIAEHKIHFGESETDEEEE